MDDTRPVAAKPPSSYSNAAAFRGVDWTNVLIFRNAAKEMRTLELRPIKAEDVLRVTLKHEAAAEVAAMLKRLDEQAAAAKKKKETPLPKVAIAPPAGAKLTSETRTQLEFKLAAGATAQSAAEPLRKSLRDAGWKEEVIAAKGMIGEFRYKKDDLELALSYVDTAILPAELTIRGTRVEVELQKPAEKE